MPPTAVRPEMALVTDMSGECSAGVTPLQGEGEGRRWKTKEGVARPLQHLHTRCLAASSRSKHRQASKARRQAHHPVWEPQMDARPNLVIMELRRREGGKEEGKRRGQMM